MRSFLATLLILAGAVLTFPATAAVWEQRTLMDEERFIELGNQALEREAVQDAIARRITDEVDAIDSTVPDLLLEPLVRGFVRDLPGSAIAEDALITAHELLERLVRGEGVQPSGDAVILDLRPVVERVIHDLGLSGTTIAAEVPPDAGRIVLVEEGDLSQAFKAARAFDEAAPYIAVLPLLLFALAVLIASNRPGALAGAGIVVALTAGLRIALLESSLQSRVIDAALHDAMSRDAAREVYDVLARTFERQDIVVAIGGAAAVAVAIVWGVITARE